MPEDHLAHFILEAVNALTLTGVRVNDRGTGDAQYPPRMMLAVLIYCYATGVFGSRQIERATHTDVAVRFLSGDTHPDHDTICAFRRGNGPLLKNSFVEVLKLAREMKVLKVGRIAVDGTKAQANASKHAAVSYKRAGEKIEQLESEVAELLGKAEQADSKPLEDGLTLPGEVARRRERIEKLKAARAALEERARERAESERAAYEAKRAERQERRDRGERVGGREPQAPKETPKDSDQYNFTDPESRIMKAGNGSHFEQAYNAQAALPTEVAETVREVLADSGFVSEAAINQLERDGKVTVYAAVEKTSHHRRVCDLEKRDDPPPPPPEAPVLERMRHRLRTRAGRALYRLRQQTVEPVFGIIKEAMGFRRFLLRGLEKVTLEWTLVSLAYNLRRLHRLQPAG